MSLYTDVEYGKKLWQAALQKAENDKRARTSGREDIFPRSTDFVRELSKNSGIPIPTIWKWKETGQRPNKTTRIKLLEYLEFKDFEAFKKWFDQEERKKGSIYQYVKEIIEGNNFLERIYSLLSISLFSNSETRTEKLNTDEALLYLKLIRSLHETYLTESSFTRIKLVADEGCSMGSLIMRDYFVQLSYVTRQEATTRESIIRSETELNKAKLRRALETNQLLSKDYIINFNLQSIRNLLVTGNPGTGKSTFSRWLCHMWAQESLSTDILIPIYIPLKSLNFSSDRNPLIDFINANYLMLSTSEDKLIHTVLRKGNSSACLILDGYDELSEDNKERLFYHVQAISSNANYILTSRPYGVLNTYGLKWNQSIQLDGFDLPSIHNYIDAFLSKSSTKELKTRAELIDIINLNPVLTDYAHNPLMLSFIVYIYLADDMADYTFRDIQTRFDLQQVVINWMFTHNKVKLSICLDEVLVNNVAQIATNMELNKLPTLSYPVNSQASKHILHPISQMGIAQYNTEDKKGSRIFHFNSITFQEYFASIGIANRITTKAFEYLLQDHYFWNLAAMLVGQLSINSSSDIVDKLLNSCEKELQKSETDHGYYKFALLLSECRLDYLQRVITAQRMQTVYKAYCYNYKSEKFQYAIAECVQRIYNKLTFANQVYFKELIYKDIEKSWTTLSTHLNSWSSTCGHITSLCHYLELKSDFLFVKKCLDLLITVLRAMNEDKDDTVIWGFPDFILSLIQDNPESFFQVYKADLEEIAKIIPTSHVYIKAKIQIHYTDGSLMLSAFSEKVALLTQKRTIIQEERIIPELVVSAFIISKRNGELPKAEIIRYKSLLSRVIVFVQDYILKEKKKNSDTLYITGPQPYTRLIVESIFELENDFELYSDAINLVAGYGDEYLYFDQITKTKFYTYFDTVIKNEIGLQREERLLKVCTMIFGIPPLKSKISIYRNEIAKLIVEYVRENKEQFEKLTPFNNAMQFFYLLEREDGAIYEADRRFFVEKLLESQLGNLVYFRQVLFPIVFAKHLAIFDSLHWSFIMTFFDRRDEMSLFSALDIYTNPSIYKYTSNIPYIVQLLVFLLKIKKELFYVNFIRKSSYRILTIVGYTLRMVMDEGISAVKKNEVIAITEELLNQSLLKDEAKMNFQKYTGSISACAAYILQYYLNESEEIDLKINYWNELEDNSKMQLVEYVYSAIVSQGNLPENLERLKKITGANFIKAIYTHHENMKVYYSPFTIEKFEALCA